MLVFILLRFQQAYETLQARHGFFDHEVASEIARELQIEIKVETLITRAFFPRYHPARGNLRYPGNHTTGFRRQTQKSKLPYFTIAKEVIEKKLVTKPT